MFAPRALGFAFVCLALGGGYLLGASFATRGAALPAEGSTPECLRPPRPGAICAAWHPGGSNEGYTWLDRDDMPSSPPDGQVGVLYPQLVGAYKSSIQDCVFVLKADASYCFLPPFYECGWWSVVEPGRIRLERHYAVGLAVPPDEYWVQGSNLVNHFGRVVVWRRLDGL